MSVRSHHYEQLLQVVFAIHKRVVSLEELLPVVKRWAIDPTESILPLIAESLKDGPIAVTSMNQLSSDTDATAKYISSPGANHGDLLATIDRLRLALGSNEDLHRSLKEIEDEIQSQSIGTEIAIPQDVRDPSSRRIGNFKLLQKLGEGGMGTVWMAEQEKPVRRYVALKVIKGGLADQQTLARFEAERQALAMMDHANIARVYDAGTTESSQPFFVMELVKGIPFNEYCDNNNLSLEDRLALFVPVCRAVHHAHQKGIIHRDLKPSNVLVALVDGNPVPKVIDFGLAKALQQQTKLSERTMFTEFGQVVGTLRYMSPEQAELNQLDVDTRTDIYSLGVMLYEVLTGTTPLEKGFLDNTPVYRVLEAIRSKDPPRPSARLSSSSLEAVVGISQQRKIDSKRLKKVLQGELDWVVMRSIDKDRSRRYPTAGDFADDVEGYLAGKAVKARPPSVSYQIKKLVRRNRGAVVAAVLVLATSCAGLGGIIWFAFEARNQREAAIQSLEKESKARENADKALNARTASDLAREHAETRADAEATKRQEALAMGEMASRAKEQAEKSRMMAEEQAMKEAANSANQNFQMASVQRRYEELLSSLFLESLKPTESKESPQLVLAKRLYLATARQRDLKSSDTGFTEATLWLGILNLGFEKEAGKAMDDSIASHRQLSDSRPWLFINWGTDAAEVLVRGNQATFAEVLLRNCIEFGKMHSSQKAVISSYRTNAVMGRALLMQSKYEEAEMALLAAHSELNDLRSKLQGNAVLPKVPAENLDTTINLLIELYAKSNRQSELDKWEKAKQKLSESKKLPSK